MCIATTEPFAEATTCTGEATVLPSPGDETETCTVTGADDPEVVPPDPPVPEPLVPVPLVPVPLVPVPDVPDPVVSLPDEFPLDVPLPPEVAEPDVPVPPVPKLGDVKLVPGSLKLFEPQPAIASKPTADKIITLTRYRNPPPHNSNQGISAKGRT